MPKQYRTASLRKAVLFMTVVMGVFWLLSPVTAKAQETYRMRIQAAVPSGAMSFEMLERFAKRLDTMSSGRLKVRILGAGSVVPSGRILDSVDKGVLEGGFAWPQFWAGKHPATALFSNTPVWPMAGLDMLTHFSWYYEGGGQELYRVLLQKEIGLNVVSFFVTPSGWQSLGWFNKPINSMEDFKQLKYRSPPGLAGEIFIEAGITAVSLVGEEVIPSAERGVIDGADWISPVEDVPFGFPDAFKYFYVAAMHQFIDVGEIIINKGFWDKLPKDLQAMVQTAAQATIIETFNNDISRNSAMLKKLKDGGTIIGTTPPDIHAAMMKAADRVLKKHSEKNPYFKKVVEHQTAYARTVVPWWGRVLRVYDKLAEDALIQPEGQ